MDLDGLTKTSKITPKESKEWKKKRNFKLKNQHNKIK